MVDVILDTAGQKGIGKWTSQSALDLAVPLSIKICSYAQGFAQLKAASEEYNWRLNYGNIAMIFRGGCIIRPRSNR
jgi:6-phosphogluconate dehydrogenase